MKYLKYSWLLMLAIAAMSSLVGACTASATVLCANSSGAPSCSIYAAGTVIKSELTASAILETTGGTTLVTCTGGKVEGKTANTGSSTETVKGSISSLTWSGCTKEVKTLVNGELEIHYTSGNNGSLTAKSTQVTVAGLFNNESCIYGAGAGTNLGTVKGGTPATLAISALVPRQAGSGPFCPAETRWTANYKVTAPATLFVEGQNWL